MIKTGNKTAR